jgi:RNA polymerase sigma factor (sigma-70 family)
MKTEEGALVKGPGMSDADEARMLRENEALVQKIARGVVGDTHLLEDALQEGRLCMLEATRRFDVSRGIPWAGYVSQAMRWEIIQWVANKANTVRVPVNAYQKGRRAPMVSVDAPLGADGGNDFSLLDTLAAPQGGDDLCDDALLVERLWTAVARLPEKMRRVVEWRFGEEKLKLEEAGERMGVTRERIRQLEAKALEKLAFALKEGEDGLTKADVLQAAKGRAGEARPSKWARSDKFQIQEPVWTQASEEAWAAKMAERERLRPAVRRGPVIGQRVGVEVLPAPGREILTLTEGMTMKNEPEVIFNWVPLEEEGPGLSEIGYMVSHKADEKNGVLRVAVCAALVKALGVKHGDLLRLDGDLKAGKAQLTRLPIPKPGKATRKIAIANTGRGEWRIPYTGQIAAVFPKVKNTTALGGAVLTQAGLLFDLPKGVKA